MNRILLLLLLAISTHANAVLTCGNDTYSEHGQWYVGQDADTALGSIDTDGVVWCVATEAELTYIKQNFSGLRLRTGRNPAIQQWWSGDDAVFIINNL
jgi:hypothetical protein